MEFKIYRKCCNDEFCGSNFLRCCVGEILIGPLKLAMEFLNERLQIEQSINY